MHTLGTINGQSAPAWMSLDPSTGELTYTTPSVTSAERFTISIDSVVAGDSTTYVRTLTIQVGVDSSCPEGKYLDEVAKF